MRTLPDDDGRRFTAVLAATALGAYLLVVLGLTNAVAAAAETCSTWPLCEGALSNLAEPQIAVAMGHRAAALVVGALVLAATVAAYRADAGRRVRAALLLSLCLYPVQVGLGAFVATGAGEAAGLVSALHLGLGLGIFLVLIGALAWELEARTATAADREPMDRPEPIDGGAADAGTAGTDAGVDTPAQPDRPRSFAARAKRRVAAYLRMTKPRLMWLLCLVAVAGMALAAGPKLDLRTVGLTLLGGVLAIGASGTFNNVLERDVDRRMARTADRPVATDFVPVRRAFAFGVALAVASLAAFLQVNRLAALLGFVAIVYYSVIYTVVLKPNTVQNTVIGGAAGSLPALIGWAAVTNEIGLPALALAGLIFLWTPAHFYNLALAYKEDYARGGFPMLPVVRGEAVARKHVLLYLGATLAAAAVLAAVAGVGPASELGALYALTTVAAGGLFLWAAVRLHHERTDRAALRSFHASNAYLGTVLVAIVVDAVVL